MSIISRCLIFSSLTITLFAQSGGDVVSVESGEGVEIARGLSNYPSHLCQQVMGKKTPQVREMLGEAAYDEVIHRDNFVRG